MTEHPDRLVLARPRDLGALLGESFGLYRRHFLRFFAMALVAVVPVDAIVGGVGLGQFSGGYDSTPRPAYAIVTVVVQALVAGPLIFVMTLHAVREIAEGKRPGAGRSIQAGFDAFAVLFPPVLIALLLEAATFVTIVLPVVLLVRLYFVPQLVVVEGKRGTDALRASWELTRGFAWRTAGLLVVAYVLFEIAGGIIATPLAALAQSVDSEAVALAASTLGEALVAAPLGIFAALLYFDLSARQGALRR